MAKVEAHRESPQSSIEDELMKVQSRKSFWRGGVKNHRSAARSDIDMAHRIIKRANDIHLSPSSAWARYKMTYHRYTRLLRPYSVKFKARRAKLSNAKCYHQPTAIPTTRQRASKGERYARRYKPAGSTALCFVFGFCMANLYVMRGISVSRGSAVLVEIVGITEIMTKG